MAKKDKKNKSEVQQANAVPPVDNNPQQSNGGRIPPAKVHSEERVKNLPGAMQPPTRVPLSQPDAAPQKANKDAGVVYQQPEYKDNSASYVPPAPVQPDGMPVQAGAPQHTVAYQQPYYKDMSATKPADVQVLPDGAPAQAKQDGGVAYQQPYYKDMSASKPADVPIQPDAAVQQAAQAMQAQHVTAADDSARRAAPSDPDAMPKQSAKAKAQPYTSSKTITQDKLRAMFQPDMQGEQAEMAGYRPQDNVQDVQRKVMQPSAADAKMQDGINFWQAQKDAQFQQDIEALDKQDREMRAKFNPNIPEDYDEEYQPQDNVKEVQASQSKQHAKADAADAAKMQAERDAVERQLAAYNNPTHADMQALKASQQAQHNADDKKGAGKTQQTDGNAGQQADGGGQQDYDPDAAYEALFRATHTKPDDWEKMAKKERREKIISAVGDGISAIANLIFANKGAKSMFDPNNSLLSASNKRWKELADDRVARTREYMNGLEKAMRDDYANKEKREAIKRQMEQQKAENAFKQEQLKLQQRQMTLNEAKDARESALAALEQQYKLGQIAKTEYEAEAKKIEAQYAGKMQQAKLATEASRKRSLDASANNSNASARAHERRNPMQFEAEDENGNVHRFSSEAAAKAYAQQHGTIGTYNVVTSATEKGKNGYQDRDIRKTSAKTVTYAKRTSKPKRTSSSSQQSNNNGGRLSGFIIEP